MRKMFVVARREYYAAVRTKSFVISVFLLPLLMGGGAIAATIAEKPDRHSGKALCRRRSYVWANHSYCAGNGSTTAQFRADT